MDQEICDSVVWHPTLLILKYIKLDFFCFMHINSSAGSLHQIISILYISIKDADVSNDAD